MRSTSARYDGDYDPTLLSQLSRVLFMKRKPQEAPAGASQPGSEEDVDDEDTAFASKEETGEAILSVLQLRRTFLQRKGITDMRHILTDEERAELTNTVLVDYEMSTQQVELQERDTAKGKYMGLTPPGGAARPARRGKGKGRGKAHAGGAAQPTAKGSAAAFEGQQKRKRWRQHLQRTCGSKQIWELLAYTGSFHVDYLREALETTATQDDDEETASLPAQKRRVLRHAKAEAKAAFQEGARLARRRELQSQGGASQPARSGQEAVLFSKPQLDILDKWDKGILRENLNKVITELGHGRLQSNTGEFLDIGGSTGGGSRRIIDGWTPPDWRQFLSEPDDNFLG